MGLTDVVTVSYFTELTRIVKEDFPEEFGNKNQLGSTNVEAGGELKIKIDSTAHIYENLPPEAKAKCDEYVAAKISTKESYCESYDW